MKYTPKSIKRTLKKCINEICEHPEVFEKNPEKDFMRSRKLPFKQVLNSVLSMSTVSAFVQQRNKVNYRAFESLFHLNEFSTFKEEYIQMRLYKEEDV